MARKPVRYSKGWDSAGIRGKLYGRKWRNARALFLAARPWCAFCEADGKMVAAEVVDHIAPHRGDLAVFWDRANWQALCAWHHNREKAMEEIAGYSSRLGEDGWPVDPQHPSNSGITPVSGKARPLGLKRLTVPVFLVAGPPGAGKTTWCRENLTDGDLLIDLDEIGARLWGEVRRRRPLFVPMYRERNRMLLEAATRKSGRVFLPMNGDTKAERAWWREQLGTVTVVMIATPASICEERIQADPLRRYVAAEQVIAARKWWMRADFEDCEVLIEPDSHAPDA